MLSTRCPINCIQLLIVIANTKLWGQILFIELYIDEEYRIGVWYVDSKAYSHWMTCEKIKVSYLKVAICIEKLQIVIFTSQQWMVKYTLKGLSYHQ